LGNQDAKIWLKTSLTSNQAFSQAVVVQCAVLGIAQTKACHQGLITLKHSLATSCIQAIHSSLPHLFLSQSLPIKAIQAGGSVTIAET